MSSVDIISERFEGSQASVAKRLDEILDAVRQKDFDRLAAYHLDGPKFTKFDDFEPLERQDAATAIRSEIEGLGAVDDFDGRFEDLKIDVFGPVAIATAVFDYGFVAEGEHTDVRARTTLVLVESDGEWRIAHEHLSPFKANP